MRDECFQPAVCQLHGECSSVPADFTVSPVFTLSKHVEHVKSNITQTSRDPVLFILKYVEEFLQELFHFELLCMHMYVCTM